MRSSRRALRGEIEVRRAGECEEIAVACQEPDAAVDAALRDERVAEACFASRRQHAGAQFAGALPISVRDLDERYLLECVRHVRIDPGIAEQLSQHDRRHQHVTAGERGVERIDVGARVALQVGNPRARVSGDHRSAFNCADVRENRTRPRRPRSRWYAADAATSCRPVRTVSVMPAPLAFRAFSSSAEGTSTVIFWTASMPSDYHTKHQY